MKRISTVILLLVSFNLFAGVTIYAPALKTPANAATKQAPDVLLDWDAVTGVIGLHYEVQVALDESFTNPVNYSTDLTSIKTSELLFNTQYFWKVRAIDNTGTSAWSEVRSFTVLETVDLSKPTNNAVKQIPNVVLIWKPVSGLTFYKIQLDITPDFNSASLTEFVVPWTSTIDRDTCSDLLFGTKYYWRIRAGHSKDTTIWSAAWNFTVLSVFALKEPDNNAVNVMPDEKIRWIAVDGALGYIYQVATNSSFSDAVTYNTTTATNYADTLNFGVKYYWRVKAYHAKDTTEWMETWKFTVIDQVVLNSPGDSAIDIPIYPTFIWKAVTGINSYEIMINHSPDFIEPITNIVAANSTSANQTFTLPSPALDSATVYYWRVRACHQRDTSEWSEQRSFTVMGVGIDPLELHDHLVSMYPNPCSGQVYLRLAKGGSGNIRITVMNLVGQNRIDETIQYTQGMLIKTLDISQLPDGIYIVRMESGKSVITRKLIVQK
jgi:hypothetical protein